MWGKFKTFFLSNLDIAATDRPKLPGCLKLPQMMVRKCEWWTTARSLRVCLKKFDLMSQPAIPIVRGQRNNLRADVCTSYTLRVRVSLPEQKKNYLCIFCSVMLLFHTGNRSSRHISLSSSLLFSFVWNF